MNQQPAIQYTPQELEAYQYYFSLVDPNNTSRVDGKDSVNFFRKSQLPNPVLRDIWLLCSPNNEALDREGFFQALKLISFAQSTQLPLNYQTLAQNIPTPLPNFVDVAPPVAYDISQDLLQKYEQYYQKIDQNNKGFVSGNEAKQLFLKTQLTKDQLIHLWQLCDIGTKGHLTKGEFMVAVHLISLIKRGNELPNQLPDSLSQIAKGNFVSTMRPSQSVNQGGQQQRLSSNPNFVRLGSNASLPVQQGRVGSNVNLGNSRTSFQGNNGMGFQSQSIQQPGQFNQNSSQLFSQSGGNLDMNQDNQSIQQLQLDINLQKKQILNNQQQVVDIASQLKDQQAQMICQREQELSYLKSINDKQQNVQSIIIQSYSFLLSNLQNQHQQLVNDMQKLKIEFQKNQQQTDNLRNQLDQQNQKNSNLQNQYFNQSNQNIYSQQPQSQQPQQQYQSQQPQQTQKLYQPQQPQQSQQPQQPYQPQQPQQLQPSQSFSYQSTQDNPNQVMYPNQNHLSVPQQKNDYQNSGTMAQSIMSSPQFGQNEPSPNQMGLSKNQPNQFQNQQQQQQFNQSQNMQNSFEPQQILLSQQQSMKQTNSLQTSENQQQIEVSKQLSFQNQSIEVSKQESQQQQERQNSQSNQLQSNPFSSQPQQQQAEEDYYQQIQQQKHQQTLLTSALKGQVILEDENKEKKHVKFADNQNPQNQQNQQDWNNWNNYGVDQSQPWNSKDHPW